MASGIGRRAKGNVRAKRYNGVTACGVKASRREGIKVSRRQAPGTLEIKNRDNFAPRPREATYPYCSCYKQAVFIDFVLCT